MSKEKECKSKIIILEALFYIFLVDVFLNMTTKEEREELKKEVSKDLKGVC